MVDTSGKIKGKISIVDIVLVVAVALLVVGFIYRQWSPVIEQIIGANTPLTIVLEAEGHRHFTTDAISVGDVVFRMHERQPIGTVVDIELLPSLYYLHRTDGTAVLVQQEQRATIRITLEAVGSVSTTGSTAGFFFVNGTDHMAPGSDVQMVTNRVNMPNARVVSVQERAED